MFNDIGLGDLDATENASHSVTSLFPPPPPPRCQHWCTFPLPEYSKLHLQVSLRWENRKPIIHYLNTRTGTLTH